MADSITLGLTDLANEMHKISISRGFYTKEHEIGTLLMRIVSELGEVQEADRRGRHANEKLVGKGKFFRRNYVGSEEWILAFEEHVKDTFEDELADAMILLLDLIGYMGVDIDKFIVMKQRYNQTRPMCNGKKY